MFHHRFHQSSRESSGENVTPSHRPSPSFPVSHGEARETSPLSHGNNLESVFLHVASARSIHHMFHLSVAPEANTRLLLSTYERANVFFFEIDKVACQCCLTILAIFGPNSLVRHRGKRLPLRLSGSDFLVF